MLDEGGLQDGRGGLNGIFELLGQCRAPVKSLS